MPACQCKKCDCQFVWSTVEHNSATTYSELCTTPQKMYITDLSTCTHPLSCTHTHGIPQCSRCGGYAGLCERGRRSPCMLLCLKRAVLPPDPADSPVPPFHSYTVERIGKTQTRLDQYIRPWQSFLPFSCSFSLLADWVVGPTTRKIAWGTQQFLLL